MQLIAGHKKNENNVVLAEGRKYFASCNRRRRNSFVTDSRFFLRFSDKRYEK